MGSIDEASLDQFSFLVEMTEHIRDRECGGNNAVLELGQYCPIFVWLLMVVVSSFNFFLPMYLWLLSFFMFPCVIMFYGQFSSICSYNIEWNGDSVYYLFQLVVLSWLSDLSLTGLQLRFGRG